MASPPGCSAIDFCVSPNQALWGGCGVGGCYIESREGATETESLYSWIYIALLELGICQPAASCQNCQPAGNIPTNKMEF
jgi:hypothetical protein